MAAPGNGLGSTHSSPGNVNSWSSQGAYGGMGNMFTGAARVQAGPKPYQTPAQGPAAPKADMQGILGALQQRGLQGPQMACPQPMPQIAKTAYATDNLFVRLIERMKTPALKQAGDHGRAHACGLLHAPGLLQLVKNAYFTGRGTGVVKMGKDGLGMDGTTGRAMARTQGLPFPILGGLSILSGGTQNETAHKSPFIEKQAAPKWIKLLQKGMLSPQATERVAGSMSPGAFRTVGNLGRGQFNLADHVVGNVGGYAGPMVRKLPSHAYTDASLAYNGLKPYVEHVNKMVPTETGAPLIAPYLETGSKGAFQRFGNQEIYNNMRLRYAQQRPAMVNQFKDSFAERGSNWATGMSDWFVPKVPGTAQLSEARSQLLPEEAYKWLSDLHPGNIGPGGQVFDFAAKRAPGVGWSPSTAKRVSMHSSTNPVLQERGKHIPGGMDEYANAHVPLSPAQTAESRQMDNAIRHFYAQPAEARAAFPGVSTQGPQNNMKYVFDSHATHGYSTPTGGQPKPLMPQRPSQSPTRIGMGLLAPIGAAGAGYSAYNTK